MVDSTYGWNIISDDFFFFIIHGQIETVHVCNRATCIYPFHEISCNFGSGVFFYPPPPPHPPTGQTVKKKFISWIYPFHEISCNFGSSVFPPPPPAKQWKKNLFMDLSFSWNFLLMMTIACLTCWDLGSTRFQVIYLCQPKHLIKGEQGIQECRSWLAHSLFSVKPLNSGPSEVDAEEGSR